MTDTNGAVITEEGGWTLLQKQTPATSVAVAAEWKLQGTPTLEDADWTLGVSGNWLAHVVAFKPAGTSAARIELTPPPLQHPITDSRGNVLSASSAWAAWFWKLSLLVNAGVASGTTAQRPTSGLWVGRFYWDTTLGKPVFVKGLNPTAWVDGAGVAS